MNFINKNGIIIHTTMMHKSKTLLYSRKKQSSSSPDTKRSNIVKPTCSPIQQIQKFLAINQHQVKIKAQTQANKLIPSNQKSQTTQIQKQQRYKSIIQQLEAELAKYKGQITELAQKNKKLEEQMGLILEELESRWVDVATQSSPKNQQHLRTLQTSADHTPSKIYPTPSRQHQKSPHKDQQIEYLYQYIENLQDTMRQMLAQTQQLQSDIKKGVKKDLTEMEQRLMNYIFGLEERVSESTFRNYDLLKKIQTARDRDQEDLDSIKRSGNSDPRDSSNYFQLSMTDGKSMEVNGKKDSLVSMINIEVSNQSEQIPATAEKIIKNQHSLSQTPKISTKFCQKCAQYLKNIEQLTSKNKKLEGDLQKYHKLLSDTKKELITIQNQKEPHQSHHSEHKPSQSPRKSMAPHKQQLETNLAAIRQQQSSGQQSELQIKNTKLKQRANLLQSNINILVDSSGQSSFTQEKPMHIEEILHKSSSENAENYMRLDKVKDQLVHIMQELQSIIHECQGQPKNGLVNQLERKLNQQVQYIYQLEEEVSRLRMEIEESRTSREKLQKFMKVQVKQQQNHSSYFRPLADPISCIDHKATKGKLNHILNQIKKFEIELDGTDLKKSKAKSSGV